MENISGVHKSEITWQSKSVKVADLKPYELNPCKISAADFGHLKNSLTQDGLFCSMPDRNRTGTARTRFSPPFRFFPAMGARFNSSPMNISTMHGTVTINAEGLRFTVM